MLTNKMTENEIREWVWENFDWTKIHNPFQAGTRRWAVVNDTLKECRKELNEACQREWHAVENK